MAAAEPIYSVTLHHLAPGAGAAGLAYPDEALPSVTIAQLRDMLYALSDVATRLTIYEPAAPEIRIKSDREAFVVRTRYRRLCFVGYETALRGEDHSVPYILTTITGAAEHAKVAPRVERVERVSTASPTSMHSAPARSEGMPRWLKIAVMSILILGCNGAAAWILLRPVRTLAPKYTLMTPVESVALLTKVAGEYRTGSAEGDRRLIIESSGLVQLAKFGPNQAALQPVTKNSRGALVDGLPALITNDPAAITLKDADTVILHGVLYRRHVP